MVALAAHREKSHDFNLRRMAQHEDETSEAGDE
jgi:hypothetical protein